MNTSLHWHDFCIVNVGAVVCRNNAKNATTRQIPRKRMELHTIAHFRASFVTLSLWRLHIRLGKEFYFAYRHIEQLASVFNLI